jgi:sigma-B regulation protein RsbU (phosphoserine phosphatase)
MEPTIKILLVEDNPYDAELLREMLSGVSTTQFEWVHVPRLNEAINRLQEERFDSILLDLSLPDSNGQETLAKAYAQAHDTPIVVLTGHSDDALAIRSVHQGAQDYLMKGQVDGPGLARSIRYAIERHRLIGELDRGRQQQLKIKDQFLSHVSHELRSPLAVIHQFVTILLDRLAGDLTADQNEYLEVILRNVNQLRDMIEDLLEVTRAETGKLSIHPQLIPVDEAMTDVLGTLRVAAEGKGIQLSEDVSLDLPFAYADPNRLRQVLMNLIDNAVKFTPKGGKISVRARVFWEDDHFLCISITDTGCGISSEESKKIFEAMYQGKDSYSMARKGLGLGLYICKELVSRHGGRIWVESEPGQGSTFFFTLPIFSLAHQLAPILLPKNLQFGSIALFTVEISAKDKRELTKADEPVLREVGNILQHCTLIDKDFLLPRMATTKWKELFLIVAFAQQQGAEILKGRINEQFRRYEKLPQGGLEAEVAFEILDVPKAEVDLPGQNLVKDLTRRIGDRIRKTFQKEEGK